MNPANHVAGVQIGQSSGTFAPSPHRDQANPSAHSCSFILHTTYDNGMNGHRGKVYKMLKNYFVQKLIIIRRYFCTNL